MFSGRIQGCDSLTSCIVTCEYVALRLKSEQVSNTTDIIGKREHKVEKNSQVAGSRGLPGEVRVPSLVATSVHKIEESRGHRMGQ
jgi:hypothetical protein